MKKITFLFIATVILFSCKNNNQKDTQLTQKTATPSQEFSFKSKILTTTDFEMCKDTNCPEIEIKYLAFSDSEISEKIKQGLNQHRAKIIESKESVPSGIILKEAVKNYIKDFKAFKKEYPKAKTGYELILEEKVLNKTDNLLVIVTKYYNYTGGAHGYGATNFTTFSLKTGEVLNHEDLISNLKAFKKYTEKKFRKKYDIPQGKGINSTGFFFKDNEFALPENIAILEDKVVLIYNRYEAAAYSEGELKLTFPKEEVSKWLKY